VLAILKVLFVVCCLLFEVCGECQKFVKLRVWRGQGSR
jgi:hypothetical protein